MNHPRFDSETTVLNNVPNFIDEVNNNEVFKNHDQQGLIIYY
jgi:hypothetical protein